MALIAYAGTAALMLWLAHRYVRPLTRWAALGLAALPLVFTGRALLTGRIYAPIDLPFNSAPLRAVRASYELLSSPAILSDVSCQMIPWLKAVRYAIGHGHWPLWNPFVLCGDILAAGAVPAPYHPFHLIGYLIPLPASLSFCAAANLLLAALCAYLFARELGCRESVALLVGAGWAFCDFVVFWLGWPQTPATAVLPLILLGVRRAVRRPGAPSGLLLAVALSLLILAGHPETTLHVVAIGGAFALAEMLAIRDRAVWRGTACGLAAGLVAALLCAMALLPFLDALGQSQEQPMRQRYYAHSRRSVSISAALSGLERGLVPYDFAARDPGTPLKRNSWSDQAGYAGSLLMPLALYGLARSKSRMRWALLGLAVMGGLVGASAPGVTDLLARLPLFDVAINNRLWFAAAFAVVLLAGLGAEAWAAAGFPRALALFALGWIGVLGSWLAARAPGLLDGGIPPALLARRSLWLLLPVAALALLVFLRRDGPRNLAALLLLLLAQRSAEMGRFYPTQPAAAFYPEVEPLNLLPRGGEPYRVVGKRYAFVPNSSTLYELEDARGYLALHLARTADLLDSWSVHQFSWFNRVDDLSKPFLSLANVRYALIDCQPGTCRASIPPGWRLVGEAPGTALVENNAALTRAFVPRRVRLLSDEATIVREMARETDFGWRGWISVPAGDVRPGAGSLHNGPGTITMRGDGIDYRLDADMAAPGWVILSETAWSGWHAVMEGQELPLHFGDHAFLAFHLPAGRHEVHLFYWPASFVWGLAISLITLAALLGWGALALRGRLSAQPLPAGSRSIASP